MSLERHLPSNGKNWLYQCEGMHVYKGIFCWPDMTPEVLRWTEEVEFEDGDVLFVTYGESGSVWIREALWHIYHPETVGKAKDAHITQRVLFMDHVHFNKFPTDVLKEQSRPYLYQTTMPASWFEERVREGKVKVIVWSMDPRNSLVKYYNVYQKASKIIGTPRIEWNDFYELFRQDQLFTGSWYDVMPSWLSLLSLPNVMHVRYEDAAQDLQGTVQTIAKFCNRHVTAQEAEKIAQAHPFDQAPDWRKTYTPEQGKHANLVYETKMKDNRMKDVFTD